MARRSTDAETFSRDDDRFMNAWLMVRLHQISQNHANFDAFLASSGVSKGALWKMMRGEGNPTIGLIQRLAASQDMTFLELFGLDECLVKAQLAKLGIDADLLTEYSRGLSARQRVLSGLLKQAKPGPPSKSVRSVNPKMTRAPK